ncbi:Flp pilus assembly complex ATPase component TadA [Acholeplasma equirhinis]|uniref:GspE/PulE family protein n=1 Tax=Acholeplasma equirhinis TaxID=555393 RepID=UPI00197A861A|nr:ATPase, T2SS/T4P/T4SS family [Acholeplasma equirhinis]MBN3491224.1 Flp pilus assembly complex ATPase component TadA [Acholeplasma equirhinis]
MAIRAAITGHLVFSTLHTNDTIGAITRMADMGVPRYLLADALLGAIAQRLVRKLCSNCKRSALTTPAETDRLKLKKPQTIYHAVGCRACHQTGYYGRQAVFEVIGMTHDMKQMIENAHVHVDEIRGKVLESQTMMIIDSCRKLVLDGVTSIEEYDTLTSFENE